ncbi:hypothetical protein [Parasynechococcus sp.]|jgi:hypothetical protein|uniref:hypothetical protein n=1 Tax=Parasynechococcus sp. TaxID=3101203 RepID=UPI003703A3D7
MDHDDGSSTPLTALVVDRDGRLTYMGSDGVRRVILGDPELLKALQNIQYRSEQ